MRRRQQGGQTLIVVALLSMVLVGFMGLVIDGGEVASRQQAVQSAATGAALAAASAIGRDGTDLATARTRALAVVQAAGLPAGDLAAPLGFQDASKAATIDPNAVAAVVVTLADARPTYFLSSLGIKTAQVTAGARATLYGLPPAARCALCLLAPSGVSLQVGNAATVTVTGAPLAVNSSAAPSITLGNSSSRVTATATVLVPAIVTGGGGSSGGTVSPAPVVAVTLPTVSDPFAHTLTPVAPGVPRAFSSSGDGSIGPGIYTSLTVNEGDTVTLTAGIYMLTGTLQVLGGTLKATSGVLIYLACSPAPCAGPGGRIALAASGGNPTATTISAATSGRYRGLAVYADPGNTATNTINEAGQAAGMTLTGTFYAPAMAFQMLGSQDRATFNSLVMVSSLTLAGGATASVTWSATQNYANPGLAP